jgi:trk system potassium uptake protein TrkH
MILTIYSGYVLAGILLYYLLGMSLFDAINHSMAALSTGGFSTKANSIGEWNSLPLELCTTVLMLLGSMNFAAHYLLLRGKFRSVLKNGEAQLLLFIIAFFTPLSAFLGLRGLYPNLPQTLRVSSFQVISAITTTGFSTVSFSNWNAFSILGIVLLMTIGAATNSTGGGIKLYRIYLLIKSLLWEIRQYFIPKSAISMHYIWRGENKFYVEASHIREVANYTFLYLGTYFVGVMIFLAKGYPLAESMFEFASALGTVGLSIGITPKDAPPLILWTEIAGMFLGRLEFYVIFFSLIKLFKDMKLWLFTNKCGKQFKRCSKL